MHWKCGMLEQKTEIGNIILTWFTTTAMPRGNGNFPAPSLGEKPLRPLLIRRDHVLQNASTLGASQPANHKHALRQALSFGYQMAEAGKARGDHQWIGFPPRLLRGACTPSFPRLCGARRSSVCVSSCTACDAAVPVLLMEARPSVP